MKHPYQCIVTAFPNGPQRGFLIAACGSKILSAKVEAGSDSIVTIWPAEEEEVIASPNADRHDGAQEPPEKKRRLAAPASTSQPNVIKLALSPHQEHLVAVTGEDKCIRVFKIYPDGKLIELSKRCMPKRPCAIVVTAENMILCGDKFGDVYSLPLLPSSAQEAPKLETSAEPQVTPKKPFAPSATNLTVHTGRNRKALEEQLKQKESDRSAKEPLKFEHQLLLGHVSMLTGMLFVSRKVEGRRRDYIITCDRDEHIRVSRGPPQAHVVETYCLGHKEFISCLCLVTSEVLVSGGGDDWLGVWDWITGRLLRKIQWRDGIEMTPQFPQATPARETSGGVVLSGIWAGPNVRCGSRCK
ncbi:tRNA (guanine-N(7)-)-methyltransferase non-catalytic subunit trm82 [Elasticomyces elasticus]|nr:tRNA (guanine-N(7)-)-methyltransferase non-catalytic subunit trm82 [Elasticomyces elasticus]